MTNSENRLHSFRVLGVKPNRNGMKPTLVHEESGSKRFESAVEAAAYLGVVKTAVTNALRSGGKTAGCRVSYV